MRIETTGAAGERLYVTDGEVAWVVDVRIFDTLGRPSMSGASNGTSFDWTRTEYDAAGRTRRVSNPRTLSSTIETPGSGYFTLWTTTDYDGLDRAVKTTHQDGQYSTRSYSGRDVTSTDPALNQRKTSHDGLGRIATAVEPDSGGTLNVTTTYQYDPMGNLTGVTQGSQTRSFLYDSLSQLKQETQPESGSTLYTYSSDSVLTSRMDARGAFTYYELYDALHRVGRIRWSDATPTATFGYDAYATSTPVNYGRGRRTSMTDGEGSSTFRYDSMGRLSTLVRTTAGATLTGNYGYNLAGGLKSAAYPGIADGPAGALTIYFGHDNAGRQTSAWWNNGSLYQQMVSSYGFSHGTTAPSWDQSFVYDGLNRVRSSTGPGSVQLTFSYDRWGNKSQTSTAGGPSKPLSFASASNRITTAGHGYDLAGNMTSEPADSWTGRPAAAYQYDGAGRIKSATVGGATSNYYYDPPPLRLWRTGADGNRVRKVSGGQTRLYYYDPLGLSWERTTFWETFNLNFHGRLVFSSTAATTPSKVWMHGDALGSPRVKTDEGLADQGPGDPQSWNLYSYVRNNPLSFTDPDGRACVWRGTVFVDDESGGQTCAELDAEDAFAPFEVTAEYRLTRAQRVLPVVHDLAGPTVTVLGYATVGFVAVAGTAGVAGTVLGGAELTTLGIAAGPAIALNPGLVKRMLNADRAVSVFGERTGNASVNAGQGAELVSRILNDPTAPFTTRKGVTRSVFARGIFRTPGSKASGAPGCEPDHSVVKR